MALILGGDMQVDPTVQVALIERGSTLIVILVAGLFILRFRRGVTQFLHSVGEFSVKTPVGEVSAKAAQAGAFLGAAQNARRAEDGSHPEDEKVDATSVGQSVAAAARAEPRLRHRTILWVDDIPKNNRLEMKAFEAVGLRVDTALSTEEALEKMQVRRYDLAITDLTRDNNGNAGLHFITAARALDSRLPIFVYSSQRGVHKHPEALERGAAGAAVRPDDLFDQVIRRLDRAHP